MLELAAARVRRERFFYAVQAREFAEVMFGSGGDLPVEAPPPRASKTVSTERLFSRLPQG